jgi:murein DD-endopeptidase MepM/ murein hydrolase activator NlpD
VAEERRGRRPTREHVVRGVTLRKAFTAALLAALAIAGLAAPAFAQTTDPTDPTDPPTTVEPPSTDPPSSTEPPASTEPPSTEPPSSTDPGTEPTSTTTPDDSTTSTSTPPTTTTEPPILNLEFLVPRPEFGGLSGHQRSLVDQLQRATFTYALRRLALLDTERQVAAAKGVIARAQAAEHDAIVSEILTLAESGSDDTVAEVRALKRRLDATVRRARAATTRAQDALDTLDAQADSQRRDEAAALADRADAEQGLQSELGPDAVRAQPDDVTELLAKAQAGQQDSSDPPGLTWPIPGAPMASPFGLRNDPLSDGAGFHPGVDVSASSGTEVHAAAAGHVVRATDCGGYGLCVVIDHGNNVATLYGHLSQLDVSVGDTFDAGTVIGLVGSTGASTGPHLHFEVRIHGLPTDPVLSLGTVS